ncbi:nucleotidyl transferase AbiEii/AbiGii toxin family protein [Streptomyces rishiriensis]|uniref:nucleotidyl transferase AbiEii/AbiGii toxin family protein n=1 Tax=Streptomyces rishiriensis TaxID=68264 RepID=UPI0033FE6CFB
MNTDGMLAVARIVLSACGPNGYHLSGSLALHALGGAGARPAHDIDVFTDQVQDTPAVRAAVAGALAAHGYRVEEVRTWAFHPLVQCDQNSDLLVTHAEYGAVTVQMARMPRYFDSRSAVGMPVAAIGDLLYGKLEAPEHRLAAKDFVDLAVLHRHLGRRDVDSYLDDYASGIAGLRQLPEPQVREDLYVRLAQVTDLPDAAFAGYGLDPQAVTQLRADLLAWADRIAPAELNPSRLEPDVATGLEGLNQGDVLATLARLARADSLALLTPPELSSRRGQAMDRALTASYGLRELAEQLPEGAPVPPDAAEAMHRVQELIEEVQRITLEIQRRSRLTALQRAEEAAVRRALAEQLDADEPPAPHVAAVKLMLQVGRRRRHADAEEELQHHRPMTGPGYGGVRT